MGGFMVMPVEGVFHNLVIVKIKKEYPGQAIKVMHSLWGAGQMMFNKTYSQMSGEHKIPVSIGEKAAGLYFVKLQTREGVLTRKVMVEGR